MRIFQIITLSELGGAQAVVINLTNNLVDEHEVFVIAGGDGPLWKQLDKRVHQIKIKSLKRSISLLDFFVWVKLLYLRICYRPDVVHLHSSKIGTLGRLVFSRKKIVYTVHGFDSIRVGFRRFLPIEKKIQKRAHFIVAVSMYDKKNLAAENISANVTTIYNGVQDVTSAVSDEKLLNAIQVVKSQQNSIKILNISRLAKPKRFDLFCEIAKTLPDISFFWAGNQYVPQNVPPNVFCLGEIQNAAFLNQYIDVFILVSDYEGLPISIIEALSCSVPVIASNVGGISEILDGENGFSVDNEVNIFKNKILFYKENIQAYQLACVAARKKYEEKFTPDKMFERYFSLYKQIVAK